MPTLRAAFVGDLIYHDVHPWLAEGRSIQWLAQLDRLEKAIPKHWTLYPGHGPAGDFTVIAAQRDYITEFRDRIRTGIGPVGQLGPNGLTPEAGTDLVQQMHARYPGWPLEMLIPINAGAIAQELATPAGR